MEFANWLRGQLDFRQWSMTSFARRLGVHHGTVSRWLSGERRPDTHSTIEIARVLGVAPSLVLEKAGYESDVRDEFVDQTRREIERLSADLEELCHQRVQGDRERRRKREKIQELRDQLREEQQEPTGWYSDATSEHIRANPIPASVPWFSVHDSTMRMWVTHTLEKIDAAFGLENQVAEEFLREFREDWSTENVDAFAAGLRLGMRVGQLARPPGSNLRRRSTSPDKNVTDDK
jgi:transcriptional regulator with XRE-family HTH domain